MATGHMIMDIPRDRRPGVGKDGDPKEQGRNKEVGPCSSGLDKGSGNGPEDGHPDCTRGGSYQEY
jgi:hypothetical protein